MSTYREPINGWTDNLNGISGLVLGIGVGLVRTMPIKFNLRTEVVPVDLCCNAIICSAWDVARFQYKEPPIYNYVPSSNNSMNWKLILEQHLALEAKVKNIKSSIWHYSLTAAPMNKFIFKIMNIFYHIIPAILFDSILVMSFNKPRYEVNNKNCWFCKKYYYFIFLEF